MTIADLFAPSDPNGRYLKASSAPVRCRGFPTPFAAMLWSWHSFLDACVRHTGRDGGEVTSGIEAV